MNDYYDNDESLPAGLAKLLETPVKTKYDRSPEERRERAFQRALDNTTPREAGIPWKESSETPEAVSEAEAREELLDAILGRPGRS